MCQADVKLPSPLRGEENRTDLFFLPRGLWLPWRAKNRKNKSVLFFPRQDREEIVRLVDAN
jgi:hypothetical protein